MFIVNSVQAPAKKHVFFNKVGENLRKVGSYFHLCLPLEEKCVKRGDAFMENKQYNEAAAQYSRALEIEPMLAKAYLGRAGANYMLNSCSRTLADYKILLAIKPLLAQNEEILVNIGLARQGIGDPRGAIREFDAAIETNPHYSLAYVCRGDAKINVNNFPGAISDYNYAIGRLRVNDARVFNERGRAKDALRDYSGAVEDYTKAIMLDRNFAVAYYNRALSRHYVKDDAGAAEDLGQALRLQPNFPDAKGLLLIVNLAGNPNRLELRIGSEGEVKQHAEII
ncbi:Photosystem I assembly protein Ycf3 [uncultured archaeon]|nr:Photosystem I assembly protein Ycf3 [uncultured archaeon]